MVRSTALICRSTLFSRSIAALFLIGFIFQIATPQVVEAQGDPFIGEIRMFGGNFAPRGWALCNGQLLPIAQNQALFSILGTTYGGDGRTTFGLPDLRGRVAISSGDGPGLSNRPLGSKGGSESETLSVNQIPSHSHSLNASGEKATERSPAGNYLSEAWPGTPYRPGPSGSQLNSGSIGNTGGTQSHNNMPPYTTVNYIIALVGVFPSRN